MCISRDVAKPEWRRGAPGTDSDVTVTTLLLRRYCYNVTVTCFIFAECVANFVAFF